MAFVAVWVIGVALATGLGHWKDRPVLGLVVGLSLGFFGLLGVFVAVLGMSLIPAKTNLGAAWKCKPAVALCPFCAKKIPLDARMCGHCFQRLAPAGPPSLSPLPSSPPPPAWPPQPCPPTLPLGADPSHAADLPRDV